MENKENLIIRLEQAMMELETLEPYINGEFKTAAKGYKFEIEELLEKLKY